MKAIVRQAAMFVVVVALMLVLTVELRRGEQGPTPPSAIVWISAPAPPPPTAGCRAEELAGRRPRKIVDAKPVYPAAARQAHVAGVVIVVADIDARGYVANPRIVRSIPMLDQAALDTVRKWKFSPATIHGVPSCVSMTLAVTFAEPGEPREPREPNH